MTTPDGGLLRFYAANDEMSGVLDDPAAPMGFRMGPPLDGAALLENRAKARKAIADHLDEYRRGDIQAVDTEIATMLMSALVDLDEGSVPPLLQPIRRRGAPVSGRIVAECKAAAVRYIRLMAAAKGLAVVGVDSAPIKTVANAFDVERRTVNNWMRSCSAQDAPTAESAEQASSMPRRLERAGRMMNAMAVRYKNETTTQKQRRRSATGMIGT
ncbi:hypothetical protein [Paraburkholderia caballeronis]|uniref:hypothetical protein n=1 Tax=Paraburkholderia caballeronis TaxID=416943 RepID=UPI001065777C|nr:hypothetical protein [Paraburkholderia caballeronis]TDV16287.1 hypothetical protein C7406_108148 [Paraburkholderia caballeronis]TDV20637.1 hypothetical protein C7408_101148 [Paraburkholderia caballeronis]TDV33105.1 hypothetical protein C7404_101244 [Paraburkholderia caballeronis]